LNEKGNKVITIKLTSEQRELLSSYLSDCEEQLLESFEWADPDGEQFYKILEIVENAK
tara:strand:+ start:892 stop:1065 length:174 start_codon:yes stop_codon:yes gene_type:complete